MQFLKGGTLLYIRRQRLPDFLLIWLNKLLVDFDIVKNCVKLVLVNLAVISFDDITRISVLSN